MQKVPHEAEQWIHGVTVATVDRVLDNQSLRLEKGVLRELRPHDGAPTETLLLPAGVDPQVHTRVPGQPEKEDAVSASQAALAGGIIAMLTMPNTKPCLDEPGILRQTRGTFDEVQRNWGVRIELSSAITKNLASREAVDFAANAAAGAIAFTDDGVGVMNDQCMRAAFAASERLGLPVLQHAEMMGHGQVLAAGPLQRKLQLGVYEAAAEVLMVERDLNWLREFPKARYHVLHVSSAETLAHIAKAKGEGLRVTCEVSPHHLAFSSDDIPEDNTAFKMNPPLRSSEDRDQLRAALRSGLIDFVATDHAPHDPTSKTSQFKTAAFGTTGLETSLRFLLELVRGGELTLTRLVEVFSQQPAKFLGLTPPHLAIGRPLEAVMVRDWKTPRHVVAAELRSKSLNNVFLGRPLPGKIESVFGPWPFRFGM